MSWTVEDPGAGDPGVIAAVASGLQATADDARAAAGQLRALVGATSQSVWRGDSADAFRDRIEDVPGHLDHLATSYEDAASGLRAYGAAVQEIGDQVASVRRTLDSAQAEAHAASAAQAAWTPPPDPVSGGPGAAARNPHDDAVAAAVASVQRATARMQDLAEQRQAADHQAVASLHRAHEAGIKNRPWWRRALTLASEVLSKVTVVLLVIALVAIVVLAVLQPELISGLLLLAGEVFTALSAAQLVVDGTRKAVGDDVSWGSLALDAVGCVPGGKLGDLAALGVKGARGLAPSAAGAFGKGAEALTAARTALTAVTTAVRTYGAAAGAFTRSLANDVKAVRVLVQAADTGTGAVVPTLAVDGKGFGRMFMDATDAARTSAERIAADGAEAGAALSREQVESGLRWADNESKLIHVIDADKHGFTNLVARVGGRRAAMREIVESLAHEADLPEVGPFEVRRLIGGEEVVIRGAMVKGTPRIGTAYIPAAYPGAG